MDDRELLELAAKAADIFVKSSTWPYSCPVEDETFFDEESKSITGTRLWFSEKGEIGGTEEYTWSPLTNDADAFRLAVKLELCIDSGLISVYRTARNVNDAIYEVGTKYTDPYKTTRRLIVQAAAQIGRAM